MGDFVTEGYSNQQLAREISILVRKAAAGEISMEELYGNVLLGGCCSSYLLSPQLTEVFGWLYDLDLCGAPELHRACPHLLENIANNLDAIAAELES